MSTSRKLVRPDGTKVLVLSGGIVTESLGMVEAMDYDMLIVGNGEWRDFSWLAPVAHCLKRLEINSSVDSYKGLEQLKALEEIALEDAPKELLDLTAFRRLRKCYLRWDKRYASTFFELQDLREVTLYGYSAPDLVDFSKLRNIESLDLRRSSIKSLRGLEECKSLLEVALAYIPNLADVSAIGHLVALTKLHIEKCPKVVDISFVPRLCSLNYLYLDCGGSGIEDIDWLTRMKSLRSVLIALPIGRIDWPSLLTLPELRSITLNSFVGDTTSDNEISRFVKEAGRELEQYNRAGTKKHPGYKLWLVVGSR